MRTVRTYVSARHIQIRDLKKWLTNSETLSFALLLYGMGLHCSHDALKKNFFHSQYAGTLACVCGVWVQAHDTVGSDGCHRWLLVLPQGRTQLPKDQVPHSYPNIVCTCTLHMYTVTF